MFQARTVHKVKICETKKYPIISEPEGDYIFSFKAELQMPNEPTTEDILAAVKGKWIYRPVRISFHLDPPVEGFLHVHNPHFKGIKREYLFPMFPPDLPPQIKEDMFEGDYKVRFYGGYHELLFTVLPGDRIFVNMYKKEPFRGKLEILFCTSSPPV